MFIEVGAIQTRSGAFFPSKAAIKRAWAADPASVTFCAVGDVVGNQFNGPVTCPDDLPAGVKLTVVGPNPFSDRRFYGTVQIKNGKVVIS